MSDAFQERLVNVLATDADHAAQLAPERSDFDVRPLVQLRPVPPFCKGPAPATALAPARQRHIYDPYTARRLRAP